MTIDVDRFSDCLLGLSGVDQPGRLSSIKEFSVSLTVKELQPSDWDRLRLNSLLTSIEGRAITVVGDIGVDRYTLGTVERISPEAPVPIVAVNDEWLKLGLAANVADNLKVLGASPRLVGIKGLDRHGEDLAQLLSEAAIPADYIVTDPLRRTTLKERVVSDRQQLLRVDYETSAPLSSEVEKELCTQLGTSIKGSECVVLEDYCKGLFSEGVTQTLFALAEDFKVPVFVDPNSKAPLERYRGATVLTPNLKEAEKLARRTADTQENLIKVGATLLSQTDAEHVLITRGKDGIAIFSRDSKEVSIIPTFAREVYDVSGAGDTVISVMALAYAAGASIQEAAVLANVAAGIVVGKRGTATASPAEIQHFLKSRVG